MANLKKVYAAVYEQTAAYAAGHPRMAESAAGEHLCIGHAGCDSLQVREEGAVVKKAVYIAIGTDLAGKKDVLGLWVGATESSKY